MEIESDNVMGKCKTEQKDLLKGGWVKEFCIQILNMIRIKEVVSTLLQVWDIRTRPGGQNRGSRIYEYRILRWSCIGRQSRRP